MAKQLALPVLLPKFVDDCFARSHLGVVDLRQMEQLHAVPVLWGCTVGVTGVPSEERQRMARLVASCGGTFVVDLTAVCTHLLVAEGAKSPKMQYALKWNVAMVTPQWLYDSVSRRICLDVSTYKVNEEQVSQRPTQSFPYGDLTAEEVARVNVSSYFEGLHIYVGDLQTTERLNLLKRLILVAGGTRHSDLFDKSLITHFVVHNQTVAPKELEQLLQFGNSLPIIVHDQWLFACFYAKTMAPIEPFLVNVDNLLNPKKETQPLQPIITAAATTSWSLKKEALPTQPLHAAVPPTWSLKMSTQTSCQSTQLPPNSLPLFAGLCFSVCVEESIRAAQITDLVERNGGHILPNVSGEIANNEQATTVNADYTITPMIIDAKKEGIAVNELWLEASIANNQLMDTNSWHFVPIQTILDSKEFSDLRISVSGFAGIERDFYSRLITSTGATYTDNLSKRNTHLISAAPVGPKYEYSISSGITCVTSQWIIESVRSGTLLPHTDYAIRSPNLEVSSFGTPLRLATPIQQQENEPNVQNKLSSRKRHVETFSVDTPLRSQVSKRLKDVAAQVTPTGLTQSTQPTMVLRGCVVAISQRLWHRREEIHDLVLEMGGSFIWSYDPSCTHYIHRK